MQVMTKEIERALLAADKDAPADQKPVICKLFTPDAQCTWYIVDAEREDDGDLRMFGLCDLGLGFPELGYVSLRELESVRGHFGLPVERDLHFTGTLADVMKEHGKL
jgi:hypothetical protein